MEKFFNFDREIYFQNFNLLKNRPIYTSKCAESNLKKNTSRFRIEQILTSEKKLFGKKRTFEKIKN